MSKDMLRRLNAIETASVELPLALRQWLGDRITEDERLSIAASPPASADSLIAAQVLPAAMRAWFEGRGPDLTN